MFSRIREFSSISQFTKLMNKSTALWLMAMIFASIGGFAIGTSHNKPRVFINRNIIHSFLDRPKVGGFTTGNDHWKDVKERFEDYEHKRGGQFVVEEDWFVWPPKDENGIPLPHIKQVKLIYNTISNEVAIVCEEADCPVSNP